MSVQYSEESFLDQEFGKMILDEEIMNNGIIDWFLYKARRRPIGRPKKHSGARQAGKSSSRKRRLLKININDQFGHPYPRWDSRNIQVD